MQAPTAIRAAANCFCQLLVSHSDNNVKLIVLDRLQVWFQAATPGALTWSTDRLCFINDASRGLPTSWLCILQFMIRRGSSKPEARLWVARRSCCCGSWLRNWHAVCCKAKVSSPSTASVGSLGTTCIWCLGLKRELCGQELKERQREVMQEVLMDMLRALAAPNMDIRKKVLDIALDLIDQRNIDEVCSMRWAETPWVGLSQAVRCRCRRCSDHHGTEPGNGAW